MNSEGLSSLLINWRLLLVTPIERLDHEYVNQYTDRKQNKEKEYEPAERRHLGLLLDRLLFRFDNSSK